MKLERIETRIFQQPESTALWCIQVIAPEEAWGSWLSYEWDYSSSAFRLSIVSTRPRSGVGRALVAAFRERVGGELPITGYVTHEKSHAFIRSQG